MDHQNTMQSGNSDTSFAVLDKRNDVDILGILRALWREKIWTMTITLLMVIIGGSYAYVFGTRTYTSVATVALESRQEQVVDIESVVTGLSGDQATINTEVEVLRSRGLIEKLATKLNLIEDPEFNHQLRPKPSFNLMGEVAKIRTQIFGAHPGTALPTERSDLDAVINRVLEATSVANIRQSYVFRITITTEAATKSALMANTLAELYILEQLETKFEATEQATSWLTERVGQLQIELEQTEAEVKEFNTSANLVSAEGLEGLNRQIKDLRDRVREIATLESAARQRLNDIDAALEGGNLDVVTGIANDQTLNRIVQIMKTTNDNDLQSPFFVARIEQIRTRAILDLDRASNQLTALQQSIGEQEQLIQVQSADLVKLQQLEREAEANRLIYEFFLGRLKETSVQQGVQQADSRIISRAIVPILPSAPKKSLIMSLSLLLGALLGSGIVLLREFSQNTFRDSSEVEARTGYTVIGQIPSIAANRRKNVIKYLVEKPTSGAAEAVRNLRTSVLISNLDNPPQVIMSTSSVPKEGKTTQSLALTQNLVGLGKRVLLIEGDIRRRVFAEYFDLPSKVGLISVLSGNISLEDAVMRESSMGVDILIGEKTKTNAADIFSSVRFRDFVEEIRSKYDYIVIDTPPVLAVPDARIIGKYVDAILYVVKWDSTTHRQVRDGLKSFEDVNLRVTGLVLSQINYRALKRYGYGYGYAAYNEYYDN